MAPVAKKSTKKATSTKGSKGGTAKKASSKGGDKSVKTTKKTAAKGKAKTKDAPEKKAPSGKAKAPAKPKQKAAAKGKATGKGSGGAKKSQGKSKAKQKASKSKKESKEEKVEEQFEDDFADDFEEDGGAEAGGEEGEMTEEMRAMEEENIRVSELRKQQEMEKDQLTIGGIELPQRRQADQLFGKQSLESRSKKTEAQLRLERGRQLLELLELDVSGGDLIDLPPVSQYDLYIRHFGSSSAVQVATSTDDMMIDEECQTTEIEISERGCQFPDDLGDLDEEAGSGNARLVPFLQGASMVMSTILDENSAEFTRSKITTTSPSQFKIASRFLTLDPPFDAYQMGRRPVIGVSFCPSQPSKIVTVLGASESPNDALLSQEGVILVWNLNDPILPYQVLITGSSSQPTSCCFAPLPPPLSVVCGGTDSGSVAIWDLNEFHSAHSGVEIKNGSKLEVRRPTYSTYHSRKDNHPFPVVKVLCLEHKTNSSDEDGWETLVGGSAAGMEVGHSIFTLASLDEFGGVQLWIAVELPSKSFDSMIGSETDLGLGIGGRVKLVKSATMRSGARMRSPDFSFNLTDPNRFIMCGYDGKIRHGQRSGKVAHPLHQSYDPLASPSPSTQVNPPFVPATTLAYCIADSSYFVVGYNDGSAMLFHERSQGPLLVWDRLLSPEAVLGLSWCPERPWLLFVYSSTRIIIFDLLVDIRNPSLKMDPPATVSPMSCISFAGGTADSSTTNQIAISSQNGATEVHVLSEDYSRPQEKQAYSEALSKFLETIASLQS